MSNWFHPKFKPRVSCNVWISTTSQIVRGAWFDAATAQFWVAGQLYPVECMEAFQVIDDRPRPYHAPTDILHKPKTKESAHTKG